MAGDCSGWMRAPFNKIAAIATVTHGIGVAEELAQDTLLTMLGLRPEEGITENPGTWLMTATNQRT